MTCFTLTNQSFHLPVTTEVKFLLVDTCQTAVESFYYFKSLCLKFEESEWHLALNSAIPSVSCSAHYPLHL